MSERDELMAEQDANEKKAQNALAEAMRLMPGTRSFACFMITQDGNLAISINCRGYADTFTLCHEGVNALKSHLAKYAPKNTEEM
jgi:hypothetical protein